MEIALGMEAAEKNTRQLKGDEAAIQQISQQSTKRGNASHSRSQGQVSTKVSGKTVSTSPCHHCGRVGHTRSSCKFREATCHFCHKKGHLQRVCHAKKSQGSQPRAHQVVADDPEEESVHLFTPSNKINQPITVEVRET